MYAVPIIVTRPSYSQSTLRTRLKCQAKLRRWQQKYHYRAYKKNMRIHSINNRLLYNSYAILNNIYFHELHC